MRHALSVLVLLLAGLLPSAAEPAKDTLQSLSLPQLEQRLKDIDSTLDQLASFAVRGGTGTIGYRSKIARSPQTKKSIRIELAQEAPIDEVVLVPVLYRNATSGLESAGFPLAFRVLVGTEQSSHEVASFTEEDQLLPRLAPLIISFPPVKASWVSIEATTLSLYHDAQDRYSLELSEIMVFSGQENIALPLHKSAEAMSPRQSPQHPQQVGYLMDGFIPFLMDAGSGPASHTRIIKIDSPGEAPSLTIDLKSSQPVHQINLHNADAVISIPMRQFSCWAVPRHIRITGANSSDFSDETLLCEIKQRSIYDNGPILIRRFLERSCRYIRLSILDPHPIVSLNERQTDFAFSEIEVLSHSKNIAQGAPVTASTGLSFRKDTLERITDGLNNYGKILPLREWMNQLSQRHDLEIERPLVLTELNQRYAGQKNNLRRMGWLIAALAAAFVIGILIERLFYLKKMEKMRTRFAADLHDELGANLHTIALLSDAATVAHESTEEWEMLHRRIRDLVGRTGTAIRSFSNMLNAEDLYESLIDDMERVSRRILAKLEHTLDIQGEEFLEDLKGHRQIDLFLFYKESLINICRHSDATQASTKLTASPHQVILSINDNGKGLSQQNLPKALKLRARLLKAKLTVTENPEGGTSISLRLRKRKSLWFRSLRCFGWLRKPNPQTISLETSQAHEP